MSQGGVLLPAVSLARRELVRFFRQRNRVIGALGQPLIFWLLIGAGLGSSFRPGAASGVAATTGGGGGYLEYFYPGTIVLTVLFTSIFASMSTIEDRREGFLQAVLTSPIPRRALVLGKVGGGAAIALIQAIVLLLLAPLAGVPLEPARVLLALGVLALTAFGLTALGFAVAWRMDSTQGFHAFMGIFLFPMWLLSGSFFPSEGAALPLRVVMAANPLTYGVAAFRRALYGDAHEAARGLPSLEVSIAVTAVFGIAMFAASAALTRRREGGGHPS